MNMKTEIQKEFEIYTNKLLKNYFDSIGIVKHHIDSYDRFLQFSIPKIIKSEPYINVKKNDGTTLNIQFAEIYTGNPTYKSDNKEKKLYPQYARVNDLTYEVPLYIDVIEKITNDKDNKLIDKKLYKRIILAKLPVILNSRYCNLYNLSKKERIEKGECEYDKGGYFIIKGKERVLVGQLNSIYNTILVIKQKSHSRYYYISEMRSISEETGHSVLIQCKYSKDNRSITFSIPYIKEGILVGILFKALGCKDYTEIFKYIDLDIKEKEKIYKYIERDSYFIKTQEEALKYLGKYSVHIIPENNQISYAKQVVDNEIFPHLGITSSRQEKLILLGKMVKKLIKTKFGYRNEDNRDNLRFKRINMSGELCSELFRTLFKRYLKSIQQQIEKKKYNPDIINIMSRINSITSGLRQAFATGNWGIQKNSYVKTGVSQVLSRLTYSSSISHLRRIAIPVGKEGKNTEIRQINSSQIMFICPHESPEGGSVGIVLNLSLLTQVSRYIPTFLIRNILEDNENVILLDKVSEYNDKTIIFLNGSIIGYTKNIYEFLKDTREYKKTGLLDRQISINYNVDDNEINIYCDEGRFIRPVLVLKDNKLEINIKEEPEWEELVDKDIIRYIDSYEAENSVIAMKPNELEEFKCKYCEISPVMMLGVMASSIPFANHSQAPRIVYQSAMGKQALGIHSTAHKLRTDTSSYILNYPQKPLVNTFPARMMGFDDMPCGVNAIVAVMCYTGFNQEDSLIFNKSSVDRGLFHVTQYRTVVFNEKRKGIYGVTEKICIPPKEIQKTYNNYDYLDENGIVKKGYPVNIGDVLVGKIKKVKKKKEKVENVFDCSLIAKTADETGIVDNIITSINNGQKIIKIILRKQKIPEIGDKFAARSAQKGTIGQMFRQEDMPFTKDGITPDIIINAHALPIRMTINQLMECVLGKTCSIEGKFGDATPFTSSGDDVANILCDNLKKCGFDPTGEEVMYSGFTGEPLKAKIFCGPTYYQRLKHMVSNKMHSRSTGVVTNLLRQPMEGRSRDGGLRFGEMERDCMISHGNSKFLRERLFEQSDQYYVNICSSCNNITETKTLCRFCNNENDKVYKTNLPYAAKLVFQELNAMGIKTLIKS